MKALIATLAILLPTALAEAQYLAYDDARDEPGQMSERLPHEILWGGFAAGAGLAAYAVVLTSDPPPDCRYGETCDSDAVRAVVSLTGLGGFVMTPLGVYLAGEANGGDGNFWSTWAYGGLGVLTGALVISPLTAIAKPGTEERDVYLAVALTSMWIGYWAGSVLGYELSSSSDYDSYPAAGKSSLSHRDLYLAPTVTTTPDQHGASLGLMGAF